MKLTSQSPNFKPLADADRGDLTDPNCTRVTSEVNSAKKYVTFRDYQSESTAAYIAQEKARGAVVLAECGIWTDLD